MFLITHDKATATMHMYVHLTPDHSHPIDAHFPRDPDDFADVVNNNGERSVHPLFVVACT